MILTLICAVLAGWAAKPAEPKVVEMLIRALGEERLPDAAGRRVASLCATLLVAAIVLMLGNVSVSPVLFVLGAFLGYFQAEIRNLLTNRQA
ncbi:MAG: hypothetical protein QNJ09_15445 [Paracoccaceae bacterium]|nr:hypothetical protein [Paracoccaceae bacterium]